MSWSVKPAFGVQNRPKLYYNRWQIIIHYSFFKTATWLLSCLVKVIILMLPLSWLWCKQNNLHFQHYFIEACPSFYLAATASYKALIHTPPWRQSRILWWVQSHEWQRSANSESWQGNVRPKDSGYPEKHKAINKLTSNTFDGTSCNSLTNNYRWNNSTHLSVENIQEIFHHNHLPHTFGVNIQEEYVTTLTFYSKMNLKLFLVL